MHRHLCNARAEEFDQRDGQGVGFLAGRAARHPDAQRRLRRALREPLGKDLFFQQMESLGLAEKVRHVDQHVVEERPDFLRRLLQVAHVSGQRVHFLQRHPPCDPAQQRGGFIEREIHARGRAQEDEDLVQLGVARRLRALLRGRGLRHVGMPHELRQLPGDGVWRQHAVHHAGRDGAVRHAVVARGFFLLRESQPARGLDRAQAGGAVGRRAGEDHADGAALLVGGERVEKEVHRQMPPALLGARDEAESPVEHGHVGVGRDDVNVIRLHAHAVADFVDGELRGAGEQCGEPALVLGVEVRDEDQRQPGARRQGGEQLRERLQPARRSTNADDGAALLPARSRLGRRGFDWGRGPRLGRFGAHG